LATAMDGTNWQLLWTGLIENCYGRD